MKLSKSDVSHVAKLAKLDLNDSELDLFKDQLSSILDYINELNGVDTSNVDPTSQTTGLVDITRKDEIENTSILSSTDATSQSEHTYNDFFVVPAVIDKS